jgi:hypothetical protein
MPAAVDAMRALHVAYGLQLVETSPLRFVSSPIEYISRTGIEVKSGLEDGATRAATKRPWPSDHEKTSWEVTIYLCSH